MKNTCIKSFSFRPEDYRGMEQYLTQMLSDGWRLKWCAGTLGGFEKTENTSIRYIVDPYAVTSLMNLKRFPKYRLNEYMENGWYAVGKSKGCYIFCTDESYTEMPNLEMNMAESVQKTCRIGSLLLSSLLFAVFYKSLSTPAILYTILLTDIYIVLAGFILFLMIYHLINAILLFAPLPQNNKTCPKKCKRYILHDIILILFFLLGIFLEANHQKIILNYLFLPVSIVIIGSMILMTIAKHTKNSQEHNKYLLPVICIISLFLLLVIPISLQQLQKNNKAINDNHQKELLEQSNSLSVVHLYDFTKVTDTFKALKENQSILGNNILYTEKSGNLMVFTNCTEMKSNLLAKPIFNYLYIQAQLDYNEIFQPYIYNGLTYYKLQASNIYLLQKNNFVYFCTIPNKVSDKELFKILFSKESSFLYKKSKPRLKDVVCTSPIRAYQKPAP